MKPWLAYLIAALFSGSLAAAQPGNLPAKEDFHIYLLMGQSNMAGRDTTSLASQTIHPRVLALDDNGGWRIAIDPIHKKIGNIEPGIGPGISFAVAMQRQTPEITIGLVPCGIGGTSIRCWQKGRRCYEAALAKARQAGHHGVLRGVLWHQGESDSTTPTRAASYEGRLCEMIADLRGDLGVQDLPLVVAQLGEFLDPERFPNAEEVRSALCRVANTQPRVGYADSQGLADLGDRLHFSAEASQELGRRYADAMQRLLDAGARPEPSVNAAR